MAPMPYTVLLNLEMSGHVWISPYTVTYIRAYMSSRRLRRLDTPLWLGVCHVNTHSKVESYTMTPVGGFCYALWGILPHLSGILHYGPCGFYVCIVRYTTTVKWKVTLWPLWVLCALWGMLQQQLLSPYTKRVYTVVQIMRSIIPGLFHNENV